jgi:hypothetical protein
MDSAGWWIPDGTITKGVVGGLLAGMTFFVLVAFMRTAVRIRRTGLWNWMKSSLSIERDSLGLFLVLLVLLLVVLLVYPR